MLIHFLSAVLVMGLSPVASAQVCNRQFDPAKVEVGFTAYKTNAKTPVTGRFLQTDIQGSVRGKKIPEMLKSLSATVDLGSLETDNPARNVTLMEAFFKQLKGMQAKGRVKSVKGDDAKGGFVLLLTLNGVEKPVQMTYSLDANAGFSAFGSFDLVREFKGQKAFDALHAACVDLHKGTDGVSKTWSEVQITLKAPVKCD